MRRTARKQTVLILLATLGVCGYVLVWALGTQPTIGDGARHYIRVMQYAEAGNRLTFDPDHPPGKVGYIPYWDGDLWHRGLARIWRLTGEPSLGVAQLYHVSFLAALGLFTYLAGRALFGHGAGLWAWALVLTVPMNLLLSIEFYQEVPMLALAAAAFWFLARGWWAPLGLAMAGMYLTKTASAVVLIPPLLVGLWLQVPGGWGRRLARVALCAGVLLVAIAPDMHWHIRHFSQPTVLRGVSTPAGGILPVSVQIQAERLGPPHQVSDVRSIADPEIFITYFGASGLVALAIGVGLGGYGLAQAFRRLLGRGRASGAEAADRPAGMPWRAVLLCGIPLLFYLTAFLVLLPGAYNVRYLEPVTLPAALLTGGLLGRRKPLPEKSRRWTPTGVGVMLLVAAMGGQLLAAPPVVRARRLLEPAVRAGFEWIRGNVPRHERIFYIEESLTAVTGRPIIWSTISPRLLFNADEKTQTLLFLAAEVRYIAIPPDRRIPTSSPREIPLGYPDAWVASLDQRPWLTKRYDRDGFLVYSIDDDKMPDAWRREAGVTTDASDGKIP